MSSLGNLDAETISVATKLLARLQNREAEALAPLVLDDKELFAVRSIHHWLCQLGVDVDESAWDGLDSPDETAQAYLQSFTGNALRRYSFSRGSHLADVVATGSPKAPLTLTLAPVAHHHPQLKKELAKVGSWDEFDVFAVQELSGRCALQVVSQTLFRKLGLMEKLKLSDDKLTNFLKAVEAAYADRNPYHNSVHAADVLQTLGAMILLDNLVRQLTDLEVLALLLAAIVHDVRHPAVSNEFLIRTRDEMALLYNDKSVNENNHLSTAFRLLLAPGNNILEALSEEDFRFVRRAMIDTVLATDMANHADLLREFEANCALWGPDLSNWAPEVRCKALQMLLHTADLSNPVKPTRQCVAWAGKVITEFWEQGDKERTLGIEVTPICDRSGVNVPKSQIAFLEHIVRPCFELLAPITPCTSATALQHAQHNKAHWEQRLREGRSGLS